MEYITHLHKDKKLRIIISDASPLAPGKKKNLWLYLCASITSQQLSVKVAAVIWKRFLDLFEGKEPTPQEVLAAEPAQLRGIGLSNAKVKYVQAVAAFALEQGLEWKKLSKMENEAVINYVTTIKGVGRWTAEMMLMFALGREDVFAVDDLGIQNAMCRLYKLDAADKKQMKTDMLRISAKWTPYRTYACLHLWSWKDAK